MTTDVLLIIAGLGLLLAGAEGLVRGAVSLARRLGLTPLVIGLTVVAFGTSAPELVVSLEAVLRGAGDIAAGNVVGSNIANIGLILGLTALICPIPVSLSVLKVDAPVMVAVSAGVLLLLAAGPVGRVAGVVLVALLVAYTAMNVWLARRETAKVEVEEALPTTTESVGKGILFLLAGLVVLVLGARFLVGGATGVARGLGVSEAIIGLTIVAVGTSLPELATSVVAALRKQPDIAVGNVIGSNIFNLLGILGVSASVATVDAPGIARLDLWAAMLMAVALMPLIWTGRRLLRWEGIALLVLYVAYVAVRWQMG